MTKKLENNLQKRIETLVADNSMKSRETFFKRLAYKVYAYHDSDAESMGVIKDFTQFENVLYGRVDTLYNAIEIRPQRLVAIKGSQNQYALRYVASAYDQFVAEIKTAVANGKIRNAPFFQNMEVKQSYLPVRNAHRAILGAASSRFANFYIRSGRLKEIKNFNQFLIKFIDFLYEFAELNSLSSPAFLLSKSSDISTTGLVLDLELKDFSQDKDKFAFIRSPYFEYYKKCAQRYGFYVDKNYPYRLVANLSSPAMKQFMSEDGYPESNLRSAFYMDFSPAHRNDLEIFKNLAFTLYRSIIAARPDIHEVFQIDEDLFTRIEQREFYLSSDLEKNYPDEYWLDFYVRLRNIEASLDFAPQQVDRIINNSIEIKKIVDKDRAMDYINKVFIDVPAQEGSLNDAQNRQYFKEVEEKPFSDYKEYLAKTVKLKR
tara:strand:+ start:1689 stop:2981 length:1293 start_codon:yes stop_codon:yes gene_type:complete